MKRLVFRKVSSLVLILCILLLSATGCGSKSGEADQTADNNADTGPTQAAAADEPITLDLFINHTWWPLQDWSGRVPEYFTTKTGVTFNVTVAADTQQLALLLASGNLPDLIYTDNTSNMQKRLADPEYCWSWDELFTQYTPDFQWDEEKAKLYRQEDGHFYTILNNYSTKEDIDNCPYYLIGLGTPSVQKSLYEELGSPAVNSFEDYFNLLRAAKEKYPDLIPVVFNTNWTGLGQSSAVFLTQLGLRNSGFAMDEAANEVCYYIEQPNRQKFYSLMNQLYREDLMIAENYAFANEDDSFAYAYNKQCFSYVKYLDCAKGLNDSMTGMGLEGDWIDLPAALGQDDFKIYDTNTGWSGLFVSKDTQYAQEIAELLTYLEGDEGMQTLMWGIEGEDWSWSDEGEDTYPVFCEDWTSETWRKTQGLNSWGLLTGTNICETLTKYDPNAADAQLKMDQSNLSKERTVYASALGLVTPDADSKEESLLTKINDMVRNSETQIVLADSEDECIAAYNEMIKKAEDMGLKDLDTWANEKYKEAKELMGE